MAIVVWWAFLSRAAWSERLGAIALMIVTLGATWSLRHESMGPFWLFAYAIPILCLAFVSRAADGGCLRGRRACPPNSGVHLTSGAAQASTPLAGERQH